MKSGKIAIAGLVFGIIYNFAAEIAFENLSGKKAYEVLNDEKQKFTYQHMLQLIIAAIIAYYQSHPDEKMPYDGDLAVFFMQNAQALEIDRAASEVIRLLGDWYQLPASEAEKLDKEQRQAKKAKDGDDESKN